MSPTTRHSPGTLVTVRGREWVVLPSDDPNLLLLRPLSGSEREIAGIYLPLRLEQIQSATFPLPDPKRAGDFASARLLWDAARLSLRSGAGPFRSMGRVSVRPRPYQLVPLLMSLRLDPVRLLIADDVGVGKTIEAGLIAREMLDRGEIRRVAVLCPPYLCDQWQRELAEKFHIEAVVVRSGTVARLERALPRQGLSIFEYYPHLIVSVDFAKSERRRHAFELHCPEFVIVDEVHGCARPAGRSKVQQQRYELLTRLASKPDRHLVLLTATPHSGVEESFRSLLGLLHPRFERWGMRDLSERQRRELARHFVQRRRADVARWLGEETPFPERISEEASYTLTPEYRQLFQDVYAFAREIVRSGETLSGFRRRVRYWTALALLRCVMSSPAAAQAALEARVARLEEALLQEPEEAEDSLFSPYVYDVPDQEATVDVSPTYVVEEGERTLKESERRRLRQFARRAAKLRGTSDAKVAKAVEVVRDLLEEGYHPIIWCRYIATSDYVAIELRRRLSGRWPDLHVISATGALTEDERQMRVAELSQSPRRVLVATDCLSEGINLQEAFNAVVHYDLPWNPNRLEQREGRVDRYGQASPNVKAVLIYGQDNPVDGAVLDVLIRKAIEIRRDLGVSVPVPVESESVVEAILRSLFLRSESTVARQLSLFELEGLDIEAVHKQWDEAMDRERVSRTRFAQHAIKPDEVAREMEETDAVLGNPDAIERFVRTACQRLGVPLRPVRDGVWRLDTQQLPNDLRDHLGDGGEWRITFQSPPPEGVTYVGRNHPLTAALAEYLLGQALDPGNETPPAARSAVIRTDAVTRRTTLLLLRLRYLLKTRQTTPNLAEECLVCGFSGRPGKLEWLSESEALCLLSEAQPRANVSSAERVEWLTEALSWLEDLTPDINGLAEQRAKRLLEAHHRVRKITREGRLTVEPQLPAEVLGIYVLLPVPGGSPASSPLTIS
ncbi:MAG: DEAD/DEAH box helicase [Chloroflexi bacterium]|nr:DEAD/DEAH box helicase [Chloroflexota bacterium]